MLEKAFDLLGITPQTLFKDARKKYLDLLKEHHPDKGGSTELTQQINRSWDMIKDYLPKTEADYTHNINNYEKKSVVVQWTTFNEGRQNPFTYEQFVFHAFIQSRIPIYEPHLKTLNFKYALRQDVAAWGNLKKFTEQFDLFFTLLICEYKLKDTDPSQYWHFFGTNLELDEIFCLEQNTFEILGEIIPGQTHNISVDFDRHIKELKHYVYQENDGSYTLYNEPRKEPSSRVRETLYECRHCRNRVWIKNPETRSYFYCEVCGTHRSINYTAS